MQISTSNQVSSSLLPADTSAAGRVPVQTLGQDDFLKLLIVQLTAQDPLNPQKDTEFISQMASFSALEQSKSMQQDIAEMRSQQQFLQANALIGRNVVLQDSQGWVIDGTITAVQVEGGTPKIVVNGQAFELSTVLSVSAPPATTTQPEGVQP